MVHRLARLLVPVTVVAGLLAMGIPAASADTYEDCTNGSGTHCYAFRALGVNSSLNANGTESSISKLSNQVMAYCQDPTYNDYEFETSEMWLGTSPHYSVLDNEWVETGITSGIFQGVPGGVTFEFYWARGYFDSSGNPYYNEYLTTDHAVATADTYYVTSIVWDSSTHYWQFYHGSHLVGQGSGAANSAPGANQWMAGGADTPTQYDGNSGGVKYLAYVKSGTSYNGLGGVFRDWNVYTYQTGGTQDITFWTPNTADLECRTEG